MIGNNLIKNNQGFSLVEMLVTVGVFSITLVVVSAVFININKLQQNTANLEKLQNEGRYVVEKIAKEIRGREIDYGSLILSEEGLTDILVFKEDEFGEVLSIQFDSSGEVLKIANGAEVANLSSDDVVVESAKFFLSPINDPYDLSVSSIPQGHPRVMMLLKIKNKDVSLEYEKHLNLQTTISSKIYH
jgi:prepilin-type N-terminal cleavage/methylation domain-containing protein